MDVHQHAFGAGRIRYSFKIKFAPSSTYRTEETYRSEPRGEYRSEPRSR